jgi:hypothetical protein
MYFSHHQASQGASSSSKHHDGPGPNGLGAWGRHPFPPPGGPGGMPLPSPGFGGPPGAPPGPANGMLGYPPVHHQGGHGGPHHPTFGGGMHLGGGGQNGGMGMAYGMGMFGGAAGNNGAGNGGSPPRTESAVPMTAFWQHQLMRAEVSAGLGFGGSLKLIAGFTVVQLAASSSAHSSYGIEDV